MDMRPSQTKKVFSKNIQILGNRHWLSSDEIIITVAVAIILLAHVIIQFTVAILVESVNDRASIVSKTRERAAFFGECRKTSK